MTAHLLYLIAWFSFAAVHSLLAWERGQRRHTGNEYRCDPGSQPDE